MSPIAPAFERAFGVEPALGVDDGREQRRVEVVVPGVAAHDRLVAERVADALDEVRLPVPNGVRDAAEHRDADDKDEEPPHDPSFVSSAITPATQASRSSKRARC